MANRNLHLNRGDFDNPQVLRAVNPTVDFGYVHGPIPNNNPTWIPHALNTARAAGKRSAQVTTADIQQGLQTNPPDNPFVTFSKYNGLVCDVAINGQQMCGLTFNEQPALRRHMRTAHPGALNLPDRTQLSEGEQFVGQNALKRWILLGGWRDASYLHEPGRAQEQSEIGQFCDALERIAAMDQQFATLYGYRFHRWYHPPTRGSRGRRRRGPDPPVNPAPTPNLVPSQYGSGPTLGGSGSGNNMGPTSTTSGNDASEDGSFLSDK